VGPEVGIVGIEDAQLAALQQAAFDRPVGVQAAVALEVVGREGGPDADGRGHHRCSFDLVTAQFDHQPVGTRPLAQAALQYQFGGRMAHIAPHWGIDAPLTQQVTDQMGHGGLAVGAGDADPGHAGAAMPGRHQFALHAAVALPQRHQQGVVPAHARTHHHRDRLRVQGGQGPELEGNSQLHRDALVLERQGTLLKGRGAVLIQHLHRDALGLQQASSTDAGTPQADHDMKTATAGRH